MSMAKSLVNHTLPFTPPRHPAALSLKYLVTAGSRTNIVAFTLAFDGISAARENNATPKVEVSHFDFSLRLAI